MSRFHRGLLSGLIRSLAAQWLKLKEDTVEISERRRTFYNGSISVLITPEKSGDLGLSNDTKKVQSFSISIRNQTPSEYFH